MNTKHTRKRYPKEFKEEAAALVTEQVYCASKAAEAVGIRSSLLYTWKDAIESEVWVMSVRVGIMQLLNVSLAA